MHPSDKLESSFLDLYSSLSLQGNTERQPLPYHYRSLYQPFAIEAKEPAPEAISLDAIGGVKRIPTKLIQLGKFLGNGAFGKVHKGVI